MDTPPSLERIPDSRRSLAHSIFAPWGRDEDEDQGLDRGPDRGLSQALALQTLQIQRRESADNLL